MSKSNAFNALNSKQIHALLGYIVRNISDKDFTLTRYSQLAYSVQLPWRYHGSNNVETIMPIRNALGILERNNVIAIKPASHNDILLRFNPSCMSANRLKAYRG